VVDLGGRANGPFLKSHVGNKKLYINPASSKFTAVSVPLISMDDSGDQVTLTLPKTYSYLAKASQHISEQMSESMDSTMHKDVMSLHSDYAILVRSFIKYLTNHALICIQMCFIMP